MFLYRYFRLPVILCRPTLVRKVSQSEGVLSKTRLNLPLVPSSVERLVFMADFRDGWGFCDISTQMDQS